MRKYFYKELDGVNADIKRHREEEVKLRGKILKYEEEGRVDFAQSYKNLLDILLQSKAELLTKLGRK